MENTNFWHNVNKILPISLGDFFAGIIFLFGLYLTSFVSYDVFHTLVELFSVIIAFGIFIVIWNARSFLDNHFLLFLGIAYVFISLIDIAHTFAYQGVGILTFFDPTSNLATQLWIAARYIQALSLLIAPIFLTRKINIRLVSGIFSLVVISVFVSIFYLKIFPTAYIDGVGLTLFKKISEYIISLILIGSAVFLFKKRRTLNVKVFYLIFASIIFTIASELSFTTYLGVFDFSNMLGHLFKIVSFLLIYKTIVEFGVRNPLSYIFRSLEQNAETLRASELKFRSLSEKLEKTVTDLKIVQLSMDNAFAHIIITDKNGRILYANKSAEKITGFSKEEMMNNTPSLWGKQMPQSFYKNLWKTIKDEKKNFAGEILNKRKNGDLYTAEIRVASVLDDNNEVKFFVALERDITEQKEIDRAKTEFISLAAHQLRTPLSTISITTEMLLKDIVGDTSKENKKYLKNIFTQVKGMTEMIEVFLNVSRIEMGKFPVKTEPLKLYDVIENVVKGLATQINNKKINLKKNYKKTLPILDLDKNVMKIIMENLLSNAIKYSEKEGKIILGVEEKGDNIIIEVKDNGIGIPEKEQYRIFTKLFRAQNTSQIKSEGSGLGLYLVKNLAEQSGYSFSFISKENEGAAFTISIPKTTVK